MSEMNHGQSLVSLVTLKCIMCFPLVLVYLGFLADPKSEFNFSTPRLGYICPREKLNLFLEKVKLLVEDENQ